MLRPLFLAVITALVVGESAPLRAQNPFVPPEFYSPIRPSEGQGITFCLWPTSSTADFDRAVAAEIAGVVLLEPSFYDVQTPDGLMTDQKFWERVYVLLAESCSAMMAVGLLPGTLLPDWLTITQAYLSAPYVFATREASYASLGDVTTGTLVGVPLYSSVDLLVLSYLDTQHPGQRWRRIPYDQQETMLDHLFHGVVTGAIVWQPVLAAYLAEHPDQELRQLPISPLPVDSRALAILLRADDMALRVSLDQAIASLRDMGVLDMLAEEYGLSTQ